MNERQIDAALAGLAQQLPRAPTKSIEEMVRTVNQLSRERLRRAAEAADQGSRTKQVSPGKPVKDKNKSL